MEDLTGKSFGKLTVVGFSHRKESRYFWNCVCICGVPTKSDRSSLVGGKAKSCGCARKAKITSRLTTHGKANTRFYKIWQGMKKRCMNPNSTNYEFYGGRGIKVCDSWLNFENFDKDMLDGYEDNLTLDRIDNRKGYSLENCRWVSMSVQDYNKPISNRNTSGCVGVYFDKKSNKWRACIGVEKQRINLGLFENFECAVEARKQAEKDYYGN